MATETRVVLVKPGDVLIFGNVGEVDPESTRVLLADLKAHLELAHVVVFEDDIDLAAIPGYGSGA